MYTNRSLRRRDAAGNTILNSRGLGASEWDGQSSAGKTLNKIAPILGMMSPHMTITSMIPKNVSKSIGIDLNPVSVALAPFTMGFTLLPGVSKLIGALTGSWFKKATRMGDCMKWWTDSNIIGMASGIDPYPFDFVDYMMKSFPQFLRQYQVIQAGGQWASVGVDSLLSSVNRRAKIARIFLRIVRQNPDMMALQCAVQEKAETGFTQYNQTQVSEIWAQIKEVARQEEYSTIAQEVDKLVAPYKVKETWGAIVQSRGTALLVKREQGAALSVPSNIIGVRRGSYTQVLKTGQTSLKPVAFK